MFCGPPLPLSSDLPLHELLALAHSHRLLGAWVRGCAPRVSVYRVPHWAGGRVLASEDLGFLLAHCERVALREGERAVVLEAQTVIQWRALQVATATPYLPGLERLLALFPGLQPNAEALLIPLGGRSPEEILARCLAEGLQVTGSRVVYSVHV